jgi:hypothetical protein
MGPPPGAGRLRSCGTMRPMIAATRFGAPLPEGGCIGVPVLYRLPVGHGRHLATLTVDEPALR